MTRLYVLGSGSAKASATRRNSAYALGVRNQTLLIDVSGSPAHELLRRDISLPSITAVLLTHSHVDHVYGLPSLIHSLWMEGLFRETPLPILGTAETLAVASALIGAFGLETKKNAVKLEWRELPNDVSAPVDAGAAARIISHPVTHANLQALAYQVGKALFSGDAICDAALGDAMSGCTSLIVDCGGGITSSAGHAGARDIAAMLTSRPLISDVYLTHVQAESDSEEGSLIDAFAATAARVQVLRDGDVISIDA